MNRLCRIAVSTIFLFLAASSVSAQMGMRMGPPDVRGVWNPTMGAGAGYEMQSETSEKTNMEFAIVGKENVGGKDAYWFEITMNSPKSGGEMVMKYLYAMDGGNIQVAKMIMQMPGRPPMEMPATMMRGNKAPQSSDFRTQAEDVGSESITTPAGTYACEHYRAKDGSGDVWISPKVSPWGLVKYQGKNSSMVVTKVTTGAKDKITGTPQPFNPMMMGQKPQ
jgi:hypothetical protein